VRARQRHVAGRQQRRDILSRAEKDNVVSHSAGAGPPRFRRHAR
jgi:hypothetical protein